MKTKSIVPWILLGALLVVVCLRVKQVGTVVIRDDAGVPREMVHQLVDDACRNSLNRKSMQTGDWVRKAVFLDRESPTVVLSLGKGPDEKYKVRLFGYKKGQSESFDYDESGKQTGRGSAKRSY